MRSALGVTLIACLLAACGADGPPPPNPTPPTAPATNDPAFAIAGIRAWYLIDNDLTKVDQQMVLDVVAPAGIEYVDAWVGDLPPVRLEPQPDGHLRQKVDLTVLAAGRHDVLFAADSATTGFAKISFNRSHPLYVLVSTDYDFSDPSDMAMAVIDSLHRLHPGLVITHFMSPYTFTDSTVPAARADAIAAWWLKSRDLFGDELGLHIHPYCNFVTAAGLTCRTTPSVQFPSGDTTGYTVEVASYGEADFLTLLHKADELFAAHGLGKPITFRAGAWTASIETLRALAADGFVADTSALNWMKVEEWNKFELWTWNMAHWSTIGDASQPYYPGHDDILTTTPPPLSILEVPDNGAMVDYVSVTEMQEILAHNWDGGPLTKPTQYSIGFHPSARFSAQDQTRIDGMLTKIDEALYGLDKGPCVYAVLRDMPKAFPANR